MSDYGRDSSHIFNHEALKQPSEIAHSNLDQRPNFTKMISKSNPKKLQFLANCAYSLMDTVSRLGEDGPHYSQANLLARYSI